MALHVALCYLALAPVFYLRRFGLYLIPFYLSGAVALVLYQRIPWPPRAAPGPRWSGALRPALLAVLLAASAYPAVAEIRQALNTAPIETREGGLLLRSIGRPGERVMARKPHAAYFAGMDYVPLPDVKTVTFPALIDSARDRHARYLFFSAAEEATRPQFSLLAGPGVDLPGMRQIAFRVVGPRRYFAIYEFTGEPFDADTIESAVLAALRRFAERRPGSAALHAQIASQLFTRGRYREALPEIEIAARLDPGNLRTADLLTFAYYKLQDYEAAAAACERALGLGSTSGWERAQLGAIRLEQGRPADAAGQFREASRIEPGNPNYAFLLGRALFESGERAAAIHELEKVLAANPGHLQARYYAARAWQLDGNPRRALEVLEMSPHLTGPGAAELEALADSIRAGPRGRN
jgi:tetratricopeptide (TPR) repeat protein